MTRGPKIPVMIDLTMSLANRTAVYDIGRELSALLRPAAIRYWRIVKRDPIAFDRSPLRSFLGKAMSRVAFKDLGSSWGPSWPRSKRATLFVDPIFALRTRLEKRDIVLCHDVAPVSNPEFYDTGAGDTYAAAYRRIQACAPGMVFVSEHTKASFLNLYPANYAFTRVIPLYFKPTLLAHDEGVRRAKPYVLMVGGMERRKNYRAAIQAFQSSGLIEAGYELVMAGPRGNLSAEMLPVIEAATSVVHLGYLNDAQLGALYRGAAVFFFPSLLEGFGVPALEAPQAGVLPIVSRGTVLEEIVGPSGILVDPTSIEEMARILRSIVQLSASEKAKRLNDIRAYQTRFSIEKFRAEWLSLVGTAVTDGV